MSSVLSIDMQGDNFQVWWCWLRKPMRMLVVQVLEWMLRSSEGPVLWVWIEDRRLLPIQTLNILFWDSSELVLGEGLTCWNYGRYERCNVSGTHQFAAKEVRRIFVDIQSHIWNFFNAQRHVQTEGWMYDYWRPQILSLTLGGVLCMRSTVKVMMR